MADHSLIERDGGHPSAGSASGKKRRLWLGAGIALVLAGCLYWIQFSARTTPEAEPEPNLPEWFQPVHRVKRAQPLRPKDTVYVEGQGWVPKDRVPRPGNFSAEQLDKNFTHYISQDSFYWATPQANFGSDGKILAGTKVIFGKQVNDLSLICTRTRDNRPMNMYVESVYLRERSLGPPPPEQED